MVVVIGVSLDKGGILDTVVVVGPVPSGVVVIATLSMVVGVVEPVSIGVVVELVIDIPSEDNIGSSSGIAITVCRRALQHKSVRLLGISVQHILRKAVMLSMLSSIA